MIKKKKIKIALVGVILFITSIFLYLETTSTTIHKEPTDFAILNLKTISSAGQIEMKSGPSMAAPQLPTTEKSNVIFLNSENFESRSGECFQDAVCEVEGDPWRQYLALKKEGRKNVTDLYIAFLRKKLSDSKFKEQYKEILKQMINDFYSAESIDFQMAAYYNYLGDLESSLKTYLDLEKKAKKFNKIPIPNLNIANTYYDLSRFKEALPYYKASLSDLKAMESKDSLDAEKYISDRIDTIRYKLDL